MRPMSRQGADLVKGVESGGNDKKSDLQRKKSKTDLGFLSLPLSIA